MPILYILVGVLLTYWFQPKAPQCDVVTQPQSVVAIEEPLKPILPDPQKQEFMKDCMQYIQNKDECEKIWQ